MPCPSRLPANDSIPDSFLVFILAGPRLPLPQSLDKSHRRPKKLILRPQLILQKPLITKMHGLFLVAEKQKRRRRSLSLRDGINPQRPRLGRSPALQIHVFLQPPIHLRRSNMPPPRLRHLIDQRKKLPRSFPGLRRKKNNWRITQEFQFPANHLFVIERQPLRIEILRPVPFSSRPPGLTLRAVRIACSRIPR